MICSLTMLVTFLGLVATSHATLCPPLLPSLPTTSRICSTSAITELQSSLLNTLGSLTQNVTYLGNPNTSFSLDVYSLASGSSLFEYHFSGPNLADPAYGVSQVNSSTTYMIGSVTKVTTIYTWLYAIGFEHWNDPITDFVPELAAYASQHQDDSPLDTVQWEEITIAQLASHLSGIARDTAPDAASDAQYQQAAGLPPVPPAPGNFCNGSVAEQFSCSRNDTIANLLSRHPIHAPGTTPIYSNIASELMAWALESITGQKFDDLVSALIATLDLQNSYYPIAPESSFGNAIIPSDPITAGYGIDIRSDAPSGAFYASINDMRKIGLSILNSTLLPSNVTQMWLKPVAFTPDRYISVGAPWEILVSSPDDRFPVQLVTKAGDIGAYSAMMTLIPEFNVGFTVLTAGQRASAETREISDLLSTALMPALKQASFEVSKGQYDGVYADAATNSSITLALLPGQEGQAGARPYLQLVDWTWHNVPLLLAIGQLLGITDPVAAGLQFTLYPTGLKQEYANGTSIESWRAAYSTKGDDPVTGSIGNGVFSRQCESWTEVDGFVYGGVSFDDFLLYRGTDGVVNGIEARVLQQGAWKKTDGQAVVGKPTDGVKMVRGQKW